jgi:hypothetical protein
LENRGVSEGSGTDTGEKGGDGDLPGLINKYLIKKAWSKEDPEDLEEGSGEVRDDALEIDEKKDIQKQRNQDLLMDERENSVKTEDHIENHTPHAPTGIDPLSVGEMINKTRAENENHPRAKKPTPEGSIFTEDTFIEIDYKTHSGIQPLLTRFCKNPLNLLTKYTIFPNTTTRLSTPFLLFYPLSASIAGTILTNNL